MSQLGFRFNAWWIGVTALAVGVPVAMAYEAFQGPTELIQYDPARAYTGYTLFSPFRGENSYLIDMYGNVVHYWPYPEGSSVPGSEAIEKHARLLEDGTLLRGFIDRANRAGMGGAVYQLADWDGEVLWQHDEERPGYTPHHDFRMIWNPKLEARTLMYVASKEMTHEEVIALGADPSKRENYASRPDGIVEVDMDGNVIWEWNISDHLVQNYSSEHPNYGVVSEYPGKMDPNFGGGVGGDWIHINGFDYNEVLDQVVINNSIFSEFYVVDHGATFIPGDPEGSVELAAGDEGDFIFRWGNPCVYDSGECPRSINEGQSSVDGHQQVFRTHDIQWIRGKEITPFGSDLPGAGNFLVFDNGNRHLGNRFSRLVEIDPYDGPMERGVYIPETDAGYLQQPRGMGATQRQNTYRASNVSKQIVWAYASNLENAFYSNYISGTQRLPNGNTLACSGAHGHFFEVTPEGEVVWEYINPVGDRTGDQFGIYTVMTDAAGLRFNAAFRCARYRPDYSGLEGRVLTPLGKITELFTEEPSVPRPTAMGMGMGG